LRVPGAEVKQRLAVIPIGIVNGIVEFVDRGAFGRRSGAEKSGANKKCENQSEHLKKTISKE